MFPESCLLALSATCTKEMEKTVVKVLGIDVSRTIFIRVSPNRENIKFSVIKVPTNVEEVMFNTMESLSQLKEKFPRTIFYCNSIKDVSCLYGYFSNEIPDIHSMIEMFHSETPSDKKSDILDKLRDDNNLRLVISTSALGMGVDIKYCSNVVIYGPPKNVSELVQEVGRIGRDGTQSVAVITYNSHQLRQVDDGVKAFIASKGCRRYTLMENFDSDTDLDQLRRKSNHHFFCDNWHALCKCGNCTTLPIEKLFLCSEENIHINYSDNESETISLHEESDCSDDDDVGNDSD